MRETTGRLLKTKLKTYGTEIESALHIDCACNSFDTFTNQVETGCCWKSSFVPSETMWWTLEDMWTLER